MKVKFALFLSLVSFAYGEGDSFIDPSKVIITKNIQGSLESGPTVKKEKRVTLLYKNAIRRGHVQDPELSWDWGRRSGVGWNTVIKNWNLMATFTKLYTEHFSSVSTQDGRAIPTWEPLKGKKQGSFQSAVIPWRLHVNFGDLELGRNIAVRESVFVRPHAGCRAVWFHQRQRPLKGVSKETYPVFCANNCAGVGFRGGVDSLWKVREAFSFFGDSAFSLLNGYARSQISQGATEQQTTSLGKIAIAEFSLGMQYESFLYNTKKITFRMGYEMHYLFSQVGWMNWLGSGYNPVSTSGISLQGVTTGLRLDF